MKLEEDIYSENDKYLIEEYIKKGTDDFYLADLGGGEALFVVPYKYVKDTKSGSEAIAKFKKDLLSFQDRERKKYIDAGEPVKGYKTDKEFYVLPYSHGESMPFLVVKTKVINKAKACYDDVINMYRELAGISDEEVDVSFDAEDRRKAERRLKFLKSEKNNNSSIEDEEKWRFLIDKVSDFVELGADKIVDFTETVIDKVKDNAPRRKAFLSKLADVMASSKEKCKEIKAKLSSKIAGDFGEVIEFKDKVGKTLKRKRNVMILTGLLGSMVAGGIVFGDRESNDSNEVVTERIDTVNTLDKYILGYENSDGDYVDFMGKTHKDTYGNIARINELRPEISAMLIALEGMAEEAYADGKGIPTIGSGSTTHIDDDGGEIRVKMGDEISASKAMENKWKFVEKYLLAFCGDRAGRTLSDKELYCVIGAGFCWGPTQLSSSSMYEAVLNNEGEDMVALKSSGFRAQKGLLKRAYFFVNCNQAFENNCNKFLDLPVYLNSTGEYIHSAVYDLELHDIMPCAKDKNGKYKKNGKNDVPLTLPDNKEFCQSFYNDKFGDVLCDLVARGERSWLPCAKLKDLMPADMVTHLQKKYSKKQSNNMSFKHYQKKQRRNR